MLQTSSATVGRVRERFFRQGLDAALERSMPDRVYNRTLEGHAESHPIALACSEAPEGRDRWSVRLLADKAMELGIVDAISHETVRKRTLKKTSCFLGAITQPLTRWGRARRSYGAWRRSWTSTKSLTIRFCRWSASTSVPAKCSPRFASCSPSGEAAPSVATTSTRAEARHTFSMAFEPLTGWRRASATERRRGCEFAEEVRHLLEEDYTRTPSA
jgi:hypothetical protein